MIVCKHSYTSSESQHHFLSLRLTLYTLWSSSQTLPVTGLWDMFQSRPMSRRSENRCTYGHRLLLVNSDTFYQSVPHALDLSDDCGLIQNHIRCLLPVFLVLRARVNNMSDEVRETPTGCTGVEEYRSLTLNGLGTLNPGSQTPPILSPPKQS